MHYVDLRHSFLGGRQCPVERRGKRLQQAKITTGSYDGFQVAVVQTVCELIRAGFILVKRVLQKEKIGSERGATACCGAHQCEWQAQNLLLFAHEKQRVVWPEVRAVN